MYYNSPPHSFDNLKIIIYIVKFWLEQWKYGFKYLFSIEKILLKTTDGMVNHKNKKNLLILKPYQLDIKFYKLH